MSQFTHVITVHFALALTVSEILTIQNVELENIGQDQRVQHSQWRHSALNVKIYEGHVLYYFLFLRRYDLCERK